MSTFPFPNLFIPGVQKGGTTALSSFLAQHPDICLVEGKEAHVFDDPEYHNSSDKLAFAEKKYKSKLKHYNGEKFILDATPITMLHPEFIKAVVNTSPNAKHIVMLRDPIDRALSQYAMSKERGLESKSPFLALLLERWRMRDFYQELPKAPFESKYRDQSYLLRGNYRRQLFQLYEYVDKNNLLVMKQERLLNHHAKALEEITDFLDIERMQIEKEIVFNTKNVYRFSKILRKLVYSLPFLFGHLGE